VYEPFQKIAIDYKGPFPIMTTRKYDGYYLISDYATNIVKPYFNNSKGSMVMIKNLESFKQEFATPRNFKIKILQCDFDTVSLSEKVKFWLVTNAIKLQSSAPYSHSQNGQIERDIQNVMDKARTLMAAGGVPNKYWDYAVQTACYIINRSPTAHSDKTPWELATGEVPDISHFVPFYSVGVYHVTKEERMRQGSAAWKPKAVKCRMLGYDDQCKNTYLVLDITSRKVVSRKDCIFDETLKEAIDTTEMKASDLDHNDLEYILDEEEIERGIDEDYDNEYPYFPKSAEDQYNETNTLIAAYIDDENWNNEVIHVVQSAITLPADPVSVEEALKGPEREHWVNAINSELKNFDERNIFTTAPQEGRAMKTKLILKYSYNNDYTIKYKARLVA
jgi:hypothetical protein